MLFEPNPSPFDLRFRLFGVPVRVHPWFWLIMAALGWNLVDSEVAFGSIRPSQQLLYLLLWVACGFVSILLHEMGHVFMGRAFGADGYIVLYGFGGLAIGSNDVRRRWQRIAVSAAGPGTQLILYGVLLLVIQGLKSTDRPPHLALPVELALSWLMWINLYWPLLNLLPIWPLDGGRIGRELICGLSPRRGIEISLVLSMIVGGALALNGLLERSGHAFLPFTVGGLYMALFFALFAVSNYFELQSHRERRVAWKDERW